MNKEVSSVTRSRAVIRRVVFATILWATFVMGALSIQAWNYEGLFAQLAEWQFSKFERMFPATTITAIAFLCSLPLLVLLSVRIRRHRKYYGLPSPEYAYRRESNVSVFFLLVTGVLSTFCVISFIVASSNQKPLIKLSTSLNYQNGVEIQEGPIETEAVVLNNRIASYQQKTAFFKNDLLLVPVTQGDEVTSLRYFKVIPSVDARPPSTEMVSGYVRKVKLPGGFKRLFSNTGYAVSQPTYIIYPDAEAALAPKFGLTETLLRFTLLFFLGFVIHRLHFRRVRREFKDSVNSKF